MEIKKDYKNEEKRTEVYKLLQKLNIKWQHIGKGDFSPCHDKFSCILYNNKGEEYSFTYQCNLSYTKPTEHSLLSCVISDALGFRDCLIGDDEDNLQEFFAMFGYNENIKEGFKAYKGCKEAYHKLKKMLNDDEIYLLHEYMEEVGEW